MEIFFFLCMCVLNEKYILTQQKNNDNRTNSVAHLYIFYLSTLQLIRLRCMERRKSRGANNEEETNLSCFFFLLLNDDRHRYFFLFSSSLPPALLSVSTRVVFFLSIYPICLSIFRQSIENTNEENILFLSLLLLLMLLEPIHRTVINY
jgi:hypothetical protein